MSNDIGRLFDALLVELAREGRRDALERLAARWRPRHYVHARRLLGSADRAADAVQDAWVSILRGLRGLRDSSRFPAWSYAIVTRRCTDMRRQMGREPEGDPQHEPADPAIIDADRGHDLRRAMMGLPPDQRAAIALFYQEGFSIAEIAEALCTPAGTVKSRLFHARCALRRYFDEGDDE